MPDFPGGENAYKPVIRHFPIRGRRLRHIIARSAPRAGGGQEPATDCAKLADWVGRKNRGNS